MSEDDDRHELALIIAQHHRLDPMGRNDRCTCGFVTPLGRLFSAHIAAEILAKGWVRE